MNIKYIVLNNSELGKIPKEQRASQVDVWQVALSDSIFAQYAENCGALGIRVEKLQDLVPAMKKLNEHNRPGLLEVIRDANLI